MSAVEADQAAFADLLQTNDELMDENRRLLAMVEKLLEEKKQRQEGTDPLTRLRNERDQAQAMLNDTQLRVLLLQQAEAALQSLSDRYDSPADVPIADPTLVVAAIRFWRVDTQPRCWRKFPSVWELADELVKRFRMSRLEAMRRITAAMDNREIFHVVVTAHDEYWMCSEWVSPAVHLDHALGAYGDEFHWKMQHDGYETYKA